MDIFIVFLLCFYKIIICN